MTDEFINALVHHQWKGNVRELKNVIERVVILAEQGLIGVDLLPAEFRTPPVESNALDMGSMEKQHIYKVLNHTRGNKTEAARLLGIGLTTLYRKLEEYRLN